MTKPFIQNVSMAAIKSGDHISAGDNSMLIQIIDPAYTVPEPKQKFAERHVFEFLDIPEDDNTGDFTIKYLSEFKITQEQADKIVELLQKALDQNMNVICHCHAGIARSGGVAEVGVMMGFLDTGKHRIPNTLVKKLMLRKLGWTYD